MLGGRKETPLQTEWKQWTLAVSLLNCYCSQQIITVHYLHTQNKQLVFCLVWSTKAQFIIDGVWLQSCWGILWRRFIFVQCQAITCLNWIPQSLLCLLLTTYFVLLRHKYFLLRKRHWYWTKVLSTKFILLSTSVASMQKSFEMSRKYLCVKVSEVEERICLFFSPNSAG